MERTLEVSAPSRNVVRPLPTAAAARNGNYLAVIAEREYQAIMGMQALAATADWDEQPS